MNRAYGVSALLGVLALACVEPTAVRRTLLVPAVVLPARVGAPLDAGHGRASFEIGSLTMPRPFSVNLAPIAEGAQGEPGVLVPDVQLGASFHVALFRFWEVGLRGQYTHAKWATPNFRNVIELPESQDRGLYELSISHRLNLLRVGPNDMLNLAVLAELGVLDAPEAIYCQEQSCSGAPSRVDGYVVHDTERQIFLRPQLAVLFGAFVHELVFVDALAGVTTSLENIGFDRLENIDDDTTGAFAVGYVGTGVDLRYEHAFVTLHMFVPIEDQKWIRFGPRLSLQTGYAF